jgi:hypothetical protein
MKKCKNNIINLLIRCFRNGDESSSALIHPQTNTTLMTNQSNEISKKEREFVEKNLLLENEEKFSEDNDDEFGDFEQNALEIANLPEKSLENKNNNNQDEAEEGEDADGFGDFEAAQNNTVQEIKAEQKPERKLLVKFTKNTSNLLIGFI